MLSLNWFLSLACTLALVVSTTQHYLYTTFSQKIVFFFFDMGTWPLIATYNYWVYMVSVQIISRSYPWLLVYCWRKILLSHAWVRSLPAALSYQHHDQTLVLWDSSQIRLPDMYFFKNLNHQKIPLVHSLIIKITCS